MPDDITLTFTNTADDVLIWNRYHISHSPGYRRIKSLMTWGLVLLGMAAMVFVGVSRHTWAPIAGWTAWSVVYLLISIPLYKRLLDGIIKSHDVRGTNKGRSGKHTVRITEDGIHATVKRKEARVPWSAIVRFVETDDYLFVYTGPSEAIVIPTARIKAGDPAAFADALREHIRQSRRAA